MIESGTDDRRQPDEAGEERRRVRGTWSAPSVSEARSELIVRFADALAEGGGFAELRAGDLGSLEGGPPDVAAVLVRDADADICEAKPVELLTATAERGCAVVVEFAESLAADLERPERPRSAREDAVALRDALPDAVLLAGRHGRGRVAGDRRCRGWRGAAGGLRHRACVARLHGRRAGGDQHGGRGGRHCRRRCQRAVSSRSHEANQELRRANARLAREHLGRYDSAAATLIHKLGVELRQTQELAEALEAERARVYSELIDDVGPERDELLRRLRMPHHRLMDNLALSLLRIPLVGVVLRARARRRGGA